ncbi:MAG: O-antigen ligase family protein [Planctomycetota bacterium]
MAKRRRVKRGPDQNASADNDSDPLKQPEMQASSPFRHNESRLSVDPLSIAAGLLSAMVVYVAYYPADSVSVERGEALWLACLSIVTTTICLAFGFSPAKWRRCSISDKVLLVAPWCLAGWMMFAALQVSPTGNLRLATNEAWLWVTAASMFTSARILFQSLALRRALTTVVIVCSFGLAVHGLHQSFVSLPANRADYERDPEWVLELAGVEAPEGSSERMVFENRLFDGGPTATFALANSLAAALLVGVIAAVAILLWQFRELFYSAHWVGVVLLLITCVVSLMAARSRSATLAMLIGILVLVAAVALKGRSKRVLWMGLSLTALLAIGVLGSLAAFGNREWFEQAPASLAFRFQYWRSTWNLALDYPLYGAGPGNFQSLYERYREAAAHEQIAEPHNLFFESLASGGFVGLILLIVNLMTGIIQPVRSRNRNTEVEAEFTDRSAWVWLGAILSLVMVWLLGIARLELPDVYANAWILPLSLGLGWVLSRVTRDMSSRAIDSMWIAITAAIGVHLLAAGGWTVPGVAIALWIGGGLITRLSEDVQIDRNERFVLSFPVIVVTSGVVLAASLYLFSIRPVEQCKRLMASAANTRQPLQRRNLLEQAVEADRWSPDAALWNADWYRWSLILEGDSPAKRQRWTALLRSVKERAGEDPAIYRIVSAQQLHVYQRFGNQDDLNAATDTVEWAVSWSPSNQWLMAQLAEIYRERNDPEAAGRYSRRAWELSRLGGNIERLLSRQQIYRAERLGEQVEFGPVRVPAADILPQPN